MKWSVLLAVGWLAFWWTGPAIAEESDGEIARMREWTARAFLQAPPPGDTLPFSFVYGDKKSSDALGKWPRTVTAVPSSKPGEKTTRIAWADPETGLQVLCELTEFTDTPGVEWMVRLTNRGQTDSPVIDQFRALDFSVPAANPVLRYSQGSTKSKEDFLPHEQIVTAEALRIGCALGRSSQVALPFFNLYDKDGPGGTMLGIGWSGQWEVTFQRVGDRVQASAGQERLRTFLKPGESIRAPRILLMRYAGTDPMQGHHLLRHLLLTHDAPRAGGQLAMTPTASCSYDAYDNGSTVDEANQLETIATAAPLGVEAYWLDAGWYGKGHWSKSVGTWDARPESFPHGLKPLGDAAHKAGMKMIVWFEPERVMKGTTIAVEHPEFVHGGAEGGLFKLDDPAACRWMTDLLDKHIREDGIDILRIDYNLEPLKFWRADDAPGREGVTENHYMDGLYALWDELRARHPDLIIDNCASGGRRIDLETVRRSVILWRSDLEVKHPPKPDGDQCQTAGLCLWVPLNAAGCVNFDPYFLRSAYTTGTAFADLRQEPPETVRRACAEIKELRELWLGDYYPLTDIGIDESHWMAWQFDRPDLGRGFATVFRRPGVKEPTFIAALHGLEPDAAYEVRLPDAGRTQTLRGRELAHFRVEVPQAPGSVLLLYRKLGNH